MEMPDVSSGANNGNVQSFDGNPNFESEPSLKIGVQIQNLVKVGFLKASLNVFDV